MFEGAGEDDCLACEWGVELLVGINVVVGYEANSECFEVGECFDRGVGVEVGMEEGGGVCAESGFVFSFEFVL